MGTANTHTHSLTYTDTRLHIRPPTHPHTHPPTDPPTHTQDLRKRRGKVDSTGNYVYKYAIVIGQDNIAMSFLFMTAAYVSYVPHVR